MDGIHIVCHKGQVTNEKSFSMSFTAVSVRLFFGTGRTEQCRIERRKMENKEKFSLLSDIYKLELNIKSFSVAFFKISVAIRPLV